MMKKNIAAFVFAISVMFAMYMPTQAKDTKNNSNIITNQLPAASDGVRYMYMRGKRYKVRYKTYRKHGRLHYRITGIRRA